MVLGKKKFRDMNGNIAATVFACRASHGKMFYTCNLQKSYMPKGSAKWRVLSISMTKQEVTRTIVVLQSVIREMK